MPRRPPFLHASLARLWAPWRLEYIKSAGKDTRCFLCALPRLKNDRQNLILARGRLCLVMLNKYPYNNGHLLVAPYRHVADPGRLTDAEALELWRLAALAMRALDRTVRPHGYNLGINLGRPAGAGLPGHLHLHLVPRWSGDVNFMPVVGDTKVLPLTLLQTWDMLAPAMDGAEVMRKRGRGAGRSSRR
jgi:ATP adenylyltransferase